MFAIASLKCTFLVFLLMLVTILLNVSDSGDATVVLRPRGVPLSKKSFYDPSKNFNCLDGSGTFPFYYINDDYCDCEDGSDEPGTAACPNGVFHCTNAGFVSKEIPSSRVNDGICDCCDASDEYNSTTECLNTCKELGQYAREAAKKLQDDFLKGFQLRIEMAKQGKQKKEEFKVKLQELKREREEAQKIRDEKEAIKKDAEEKEKTALEVYEKEKEEKQKHEEEKEELRNEQAEQVSATQAFKELDVNGDGKVTYQELQKFTKFDYNHDGEVSEEEAKFFLHMKDEMNLEEFITVGWVIMKPIYKYMLDEPESDKEELITEKPETVEEDSTNEDQEDATQDPDNEEALEGDEDDMDDEDLVPPEFPPREDIPQRDDKRSSAYSEEVQKVVDVAKQARQEFNDAEHRLQRLSDEIRDVEQSLECDYGPEEEFAVLKGQCFEFHDREYAYKFCPFDHATQEPKSGGSSVNLGKWGKWAGPDDNKFSKMKLESGVVCWNGPARSVIVNIHCGTENKLIAATEPGRCEYQYDFVTPALCSTPPLQFQDIHDKMHTEL